MTVTHRQEEGPFTRMLDRLRLGNLSRADEQLLRTRYLSPDPAGPTLDTAAMSLQQFLLTTPVVAARLQLTRAYNELFQTLHSAVTGRRKFTIRPAKPGQPPPPLPQSFDDQNRREEKGRLLYLAVGDRVLLTKNIAPVAGLCNRTRAVVTALAFASKEAADAGHLPTAVAITTASGLLVVLEPTTVSSSSDDVRTSSAGLLSFPLILAYSMSIHKTQGLTMPRLIADLRGAKFSCALHYTALSRARSLDSISLLYPVLADSIVPLNKHMKNELALNENLHLYPVIRVPTTSLSQPRAAGPLFFRKYVSTRC